MSSVRWGWAGQVVLAGRDTRAESGMVLQVPGRSGALPHLGKTGFRLDASEGNIEFLQGCKTLKARNWTSWADQVLLKWEKWQCWEKRGWLKASVGICGRKWLPYLCRHHDNIHAHSLPSHQTEHQVLGVGTGNETISLHERKARRSYVGERWEEKMYEGHFSLPKTSQFLKSVFPAALGHLLS